MNRTLSIYLDLIRFVGSVFVFMVHSNVEKFGMQGWFSFAQPHGRSAVMMFLVMSGFVISYVAATKEHNVREFASSRFARLYSVVFPALVFTILADSIGHQIDPEIYSRDFVGEQPVLRFLLTLFFVNEIWFMNWHPFSNAPFWSISYEFWYYVIFAAWFYFDGWRRALLTTVAILIAGPKIWLLAPLWVMGYLVYRIIPHLNLRLLPAFLLAVTPVVAYLAHTYAGGPAWLLSKTVVLLSPEWLMRIKYSLWFMNDNVIGFLVATHFLGMSQLARYIDVPKMMERVIRYFSGMTFALYLFHFPLLMLYATFVKNGAVLFVSVFLTVLFIAPFTEGRKREWKRFVDAVWDRLSPRART